MTTVTHTKAYRTWVERIESGTFTKAQCNQFAKTITAIADGDYPRGKQTNITPNEAQELVDQLSANPVGLTPEHTQQGLTWLRNRGAKTLGIDQEILDSVVSFTYDGGAECRDYSNRVPIWRAHLSDGRTFEYYNVAWVSATNDNGWWWV